jgi:hypothetical protein
MAKTTIVFGVLLIGVGLVAYFGSSPKVELRQEETSQLEGASPVYTRQSLVDIQSSDQSAILDRLLSNKPDRPLI